MHNIIRKVMISSIIAFLLLITFGTITFAWIGFSSYSRFEPFEITLDVNDIRDTQDIFKQAYGLEISLTGEEGSFSTSISPIDLKRHILANYDVDVDNNWKNPNIKTNTEVTEEFGKIGLDQATLIYSGDTSNYSFLNDDETKFEFIDIDGNPTKKVFNFDLYVSVYSVFPIDDPTVKDKVTDNLNCYLTGEILKGTTKSVATIYPFTYPERYSKNYPVTGIHINDSIDYTGAVGVGANTVIEGIRTVNSVSSARIAFAKHKVVDKNNPSQYNSDNKIRDYVIYRYGSNMPTVNNHGIYSFGGILEDDINYALQSYNIKHKDDIKTIPDVVLTRKTSDIEYIAKEDNQLINNQNSKEAISTSKMMKISVYFWFEGWDADCFEAIDRSPVSINIGLTAYKEKEENS